MAIVSGEDNRQACRKALSGINVAVLLGGGDTLFSGNATVTGVITAINALAPIAGGSPDARRAAGEGLRDGVLCGAIPETHGVSTIAAARALLTANLPDVAATYTGELPQ